MAAMIVSVLGHGGKTGQQFFEELQQVVEQLTGTSDGRGGSGDPAADNSSRERLEDRKADSRHSSIHHISVGRMETEDSSPAF
ncbi:hypothetical protein PoB_004422000 [Plakobranchus ocellatus]|uniref:Uncharacterized protein n=1 Tax=Plakobranchus ocellatus TaxID=259542 RepID=A0AAV4BF10_9GAST|nr:hypothetical protein PoB_004422000 [Plakobranchus ocellatus]